MASSTVAGAFQPRSGIPQPEHAVHLAGRHSLSSAYSAPAPTSTMSHPPFEGIVDFSYHQPHFGQYSGTAALPASDATTVHHHHAQSRSDGGSDWKQSAFFSYRPNEVKHRKRTTRQQLKVLEDTFRTTQKPDGNVRKSLALQLNMTPRNVQVWFQNRRAKDKTLAKRALKTVDEGKTAASPTDLDSETVGNSIDGFTSPVAPHQSFVYPSSESYSPPAASTSEHDFRVRYGSSVDTHSGSASPIETVFPTQYDVPTPVYPVNGVVSPASSSFSQSDVQAPAYHAPTNYPAAYARDMFAPRGSLPHIHAPTFAQDSQHQRSASSPALPSNVDSSSNLSLTTYASINGMLYPQQQQPRFLNAQPMFAAATGIQRTGPLPAADFTFGMPARSDAETETEASGYQSYSQFGSVSGSDTPSSHSGLSHYGSMASLTDSTRSFDEDGVPHGWKGEQRRGSIPLGVRPSFGNLASRGFSPLSVGYSSNSPCPQTEAESENSENALYRADWSATQANECKPAFKREDIESSQTLGYQRGSYTFNGLVNQEAASEAYQQYIAYGHQQQQTLSDNMLGYNYVQPEMSELQMPRPTAAVAYGTYGFA